MSEIKNAEYNEIYVVNEKDGEKLKKTEVEINALTIQANQMALTYVIAIGKKLAEAKEMVNFGQWGEWCNKKINYSQSTAENYIKIYEEYGSEQLSLFKNVNSETILKLPYTKALALIALPAEERENFVKENDVENISVRELKDIIKRKEEESTGMKAEIEKLKKDISAKEARIDELQEQMEAESETPSFSDEELSKLKSEIEAENVKKNKAKIDKLTAVKKALEEKVKVLEETVKNRENQIDEINSDSDNIIAQLKEEKEAAEKKVDSIQSKIENSGRLQVINIYLDAMQDYAQKLYNEIEILQKDNPETATKISCGIKTLFSEIIDKF